MTLLDDERWLARRFEEYRTRLRVVAFRILGSLGDAHEAVQGAWLRFSPAGAEASQYVRLRRPRPCDELVRRHGVDDHFG